MQTTVAYAMKLNNQTPGSAKSYRALRRNTISLSARRITVRTKNFARPLIVLRHEAPQSTRYFHAFRCLTMRLST